MVNKTEAHVQATTHEGGAVILRCHLRSFVGIRCVKQSGVRRNDSARPRAGDQDEVRDHAGALAGADARLSPPSLLRPARAATRHPTRQGSRLARAPRG